MLTFGSLFSGIGGLDLGLERTGGMKVLWQIENDPYANRVLQKHWPTVKRYTDIRTLAADTLEKVDVLAGGFPCQSVSLASQQLGKRKGVNDERWLWPYFNKCISLLEPRYILLENVPGIFTAGDAFTEIQNDLQTDLAHSRYDTEWSLLSAKALGGAHVRDRFFLIGIRRDQDVSDSERNTKRPAHGSASRIGDERENASISEGSQVWGNTPDSCLPRRGFRELSASIRRTADGVPHRLDRLRGLGNAVTPPQAEFVGRRLLQIHSMRATSEE
jgi:DNA (cytosine-5)-methyltransferase 1